MKLPILAALLLLAPATALAQVANIKVVTDANPDYSDMESMVHSITSNWSSDAEKMYALFYWDHIARRQTAPMMLHGIELTDPIRQYNDYGFTMCSTISGIKNSEWNYMGYPSRLFDIGNGVQADVKEARGIAHVVPLGVFDAVEHHGGGLAAGDVVPVEEGVHFFRVGRPVAGDGMHHRFHVGIVGVGVGDDLDVGDLRQRGGGGEEKQGCEDR